MWNARKNLALAAAGALAMIGGSTWVIVGLAGDVSPQLVPITATVPVTVGSSTTSATVPVTTATRSPIIWNLDGVSTITGSALPGAQGDHGSSAEVAHEVLVQAPSSVPVPTVPLVVQDTVVDVVPTDVQVGPGETGYLVTDDSAEAAGGPETGVVRLDPVSGLPFTEGPGGLLATEILSPQLADAYGVPYGTTYDQVNFGQVGGDQAQYQFHTDGTDTRVLSCVQPGATGPQTFQASSVLDADARLADGRCTLVHS